MIAGSKSCSKIRRLSRIESILKYLLIQPYVEMDKVLFSSTSNIWSTPQALFDKLNDEYHFTLDPCALPENAKCTMYFTPVQDGLRQDWTGHTVFCNPPYGRMLYSWVRKCAEESRKPNTKVVMLIPARTDTKWFHDFIYRQAKITFIKGRLKFGNCKNSAPFPSMIVEF